MEYPKSYKNFLTGTIVTEAACVSTAIGSALVGLETGTLNGDLFFATSFASLGGLGMLATEKVAFSEYKKMKKNLAFVQDVASKDPSKELETVATTFEDYCGEKHYSFNTSIDIMAKMLFEMKRSGYTDDEISEYIIYLMYESKDNKKLNPEFKKIKKYKKVL